MRRHVSIASTVVIAALMLAACGGEVGSTEDAASGSGSGPSSTSTTLEVPSVPAAIPGSFVVGALQEALVVLGFDPGPIDGLFGEATAAALAAFQATVELAPSGHLDEATVLALADASPVARVLAVEALQTELAELAYYTGLIDGDFGPATQEALAAFQQDSGLDPTGSIDPATFDALNARYEAEVVQAHILASGYEQGPPETVPATEGSEGSGEVADASQVLGPGDEGPEVEELQRRLTELGYRPGAVDGRFGGATSSAVLAFEKREGLSRDGLAGPEVLARLEDPRGAGPRSTDGPRVEVDLDRQILFVVDAGGTVTTINTSTGSGRTYDLPGGGTAVAFTPTGEFTVERRIDGVREAALGSLYRPLYFRDGWAVHGSAKVPAYPASHGCARTANVDQDFIFETIPDGAAVVVYGTSQGDPEQAQPGF